MKNPNCYKCIYRGSVPGDTHSCCRHPVVKDNSLAELACLMSVGVISYLGDSEDEFFEPLNINANLHGIKNGWFMWPTNFDPVWLKNCDGYKEKE